jgi:hypothetical protein
MYNYLENKLSFIYDIYPYSVLIPSNEMSYYQSVIFSILMQILYVHNIDINQKKIWLLELIKIISSFYESFSEEIALPTSPIARLLR